MISIDYQAGAHGNFLEYVCNIAAGVETDGNPFNSKGAAHRRIYKTPNLFVAKHFSFSDIPLAGNRVIAIELDVDDLLPLSQISLLRAGDLGIDNDQLEIDTYNKLNNIHYRTVLDNLINSFFANQIESSYNQIRDSSWPDVKNLEDFKKLPQHIQQECTEVHGLQLLELSSDSPNCPRSVLREFFQIGFENPKSHGFIVNQDLMMRYPDHIDVFEFPFSCFYNHQLFVHTIERIASWADLSYNTHMQVQSLHEEFLKKQLYKDSKNKCDDIVQQIIHGLVDLPKVNLFEESYINAELKKNGYECRY